MVREHMPEFRPAVIGKIVLDDQNGFGQDIKLQTKVKTGGYILMNSEASEARHTCPILLLHIHFF